MLCAAHILIAQCTLTCSSPCRADPSSASRSRPEEALRLCSEHGSDYRKRRKEDYGRNALQICTFSKPCCFVLQNHILFCSSSVAVWCWSWICERLGSKSAMFTNMGGMSARYSQIQIRSSCVLSGSSLDLQPEIVIPG